jgi:hypothetical protein
MRAPSGVVANVCDVKAIRVATPARFDIFPIGNGRITDSNTSRNRSVRAYRENLGVIAAVIVCPEQLRIGPPTSQATRFADFLW